MKRGTGGTDDTFVALISEAIDNPGLRKRLESVLHLDTIQRRMAVQSLREELTHQNVDSDFIAAISALHDDGIAARALQALKPESMPPLTALSPPMRILRILKLTLSALIGAVTFLFLTVFAVSSLYAMRVPLPEPIAPLAAMLATIAGVGAGIVSLAQSSWIWIGICVFLYMLVGYIMASMM